MREKKYFNEVYVTIFVYFTSHDHGFLEKPKHAAANYTARHIKRSCDCPYLSVYCVYTTTGHSTYKEIENILKTDRSDTDIIAATDSVFTAT
jgi:hypothetical protein